VQLGDLSGHTAEGLAGSIDVEFAALRSLFEVLFPLRVHWDIWFEVSSSAQEARIECEASAFFFVVVRVVVVVVVFPSLLFGSLRR
jgi:hypothetical protein